MACVVDDDVDAQLLGEDLGDGGRYDGFGGDVQVNAVEMAVVGAGKCGEGGVVFGTGGLGVEEAAVDGVSGEGEGACCEEAES